MNWLRLPGRADRRVAIVMLVLTNSTSFISLYLFGILGFFYRRGAPLPESLMLVWVGCIVGQMVLLAYWFSLSGDTLWFRLAVLLVTVLVFTSGISAISGIQNVYLRAAQSTTGDPDIDWWEFAGWFANMWAQGCAFVIAVFLAAYALLLPVRRLWFSLSTAEPVEATRHAKGQYQIKDLMLWMGLVAVPLMLARLATSTDASAVGTFVALLMIQTPMLVGWPVFQAVLAKRHAAIWTFAAVALLATAAGLVSVVVQWIDRANSSRMNLAAVFGFWPLETFLLAAIGALGVNTFILRWLGFRLCRGSGQPSLQTSDSGSISGENSTPS